MLKDPCGMEKGALRKQTHADSPPYFSTRLASATTDDIEGRICNAAPDEFGGTFVTFLELYVK